MRIKISTAAPLPKNQCWFAISEKLERQSMHHLVEKIADQLHLSTEAANLKLSMDGFHLLPRTIIKDLLRDGDLVLIKEDLVKQPTADKKRKSAAASPTEAEQDNALDTRPIKKTKKSKSSTTKAKAKSKSNDNDTKDKDTSTKKVEKETKEVTKKKTKQKNAEIIHATVEKQPSVARENKQANSAPFEGIDKTKKRNMRRRALKQHYRMLQDESNTVVVAAATPLEPLDAVHELHVEKLQITSNTPSEKLLKKNKNKKKNHLKGSKAENRSHVHYQQETNAGTVAMDMEDVVHDVVDDMSNSGTVAMQQQQQQKQQDSHRITTSKSNLYGRAFVTSVESEPKCKGQRGPERHYPIHDMPTLFYANKPDQEELSGSDPSSSSTTTNTQPTTETTAVMRMTEVPVNYYDNLPIADFKSHIPTIGDQLAIKTLELTANYTPEISDWKQVILKELDLPNTVTFEYIQGFGKTSTKGGKFDIKKHQKKTRYDEWYQEEDEYDHRQTEQEEEEEADLVNEDDQEQNVITVSIFDVFAMKNMSGVM